MSKAFRSVAVSIFVALFTTLTLAGSQAVAFPGEPGDVLYTEGLYVMAVNPETGATRKVVNGGGPYAPTALPSGRSLTYINGNANSIYIRNFGNPDPESPGRAVIHRPTKGPRALGLRSLSYSSRSHRIVFSAAKGGYYIPDTEKRIEIYSIRTDGSGLTQLTHNRVFDNDPAVSPDGRRVAFARHSKGQTNIFTMNIDGSHQRKLSRGPGYKRAPSFSPTGRRIVYFGNLKRPGLDPWASAELFTISSRTGRKKVRLTRNQVKDFYPSFSPDGRRIAFTRGDKKVMSVRTNGKGTRLLATSSYPGGIGATDWAVRP